MSDLINGPRNGTSEPVADLAPEESFRFEALQRYTRNLQPMGYITTDLLAALWDERVRRAEWQRQAEPDDLNEIELRQRLATQALQAYRFLSELEQQLGFEVALPVLGPWRSPVDAGPSSLQRHRDVEDHGETKVYSS